jgi:cell division protein FtsB
MLQTLTKEVDDLEHELQDKITEQARAQVAF